jgi:peptidylprolyl isomerase
MTLEKGDFILINYTAKVKENNEVFDTTLEEVAKKEHIYKEGAIYEPKLVVIGEGWMLKGKILKTIDESLITMELAKAATIEVPPDQAFGPRDPEKLKRVPLKQLLARDVHNPTIGMSIEYGGKAATIRSIGAGRVLLDFNEQLAGRTLVYDMKVNKKLKTNEEKITALIHRRIPIVDSSNFKLDIEPKMLRVEMPEDAFYLEGIQLAKRVIALDIQKYISGITTVKFVESFISEPKPEAEKEPKKEEKTEPEPTPKKKSKPRAKPKAKAEAKPKPKKKTKSPAKSKKA